jgi:predicted ATPase
MEELPSRKLLGRERHLPEIDLLVDAALAGRGNLLLISGEAGIGKTRLAEEAVLRGSRREVATARTVCGREAGRPPFWPWVDLLGQRFPLPPVGRSNPGSAATGTVMRPDTLRRYANQAGFANAEILPIEHDFFRFYKLSG